MKSQLVSLVEGYSLINFIHLNAFQKGLVLRWRNDKRVSAWMYSDHRITAKEHSRFLLRLRKDKKNYYWLVNDACLGYLGVMYLNKVDFKNKNAYLGIYVNPDSPGKGLGSVLMKCILAVAYVKFGLHTVKLEVIADNKRAVEFYKKTGFSIEGRLKEFVFKNNRYRDVVIMGIQKKGRLQ